MRAARRTADALSRPPVLLLLSLSLPVSLSEPDCEPIELLSDHPGTTPNVASLYNVVLHARWSILMYANDLLASKAAAQAEEQRGLLN